MREKFYARHLKNIAAVSLSRAADANHKSLKSKRMLNLLIYAGMEKSESEVAACFN